MNDPKKPIPTPDGTPRESQDAPDVSATPNKPVTSDVLREINAAMQGVLAKHEYEIVGYGVMTWTPNSDPAIDADYNFMTNVPDMNAATEAVARGLHSIMEHGKEDPADKIQ